MSLSDFRKQAGFAFAKNPIAVYYAKWGALYAAILILTIGLSAVGLSSHSLAEGEIQAIRARMSVMPEANMTPDKREALMRGIQSSIATEFKQFLDPADIPTTLSTISQEAGAYQVNLKKINTLMTEEVLDFAYVRIPIAMELEGDYKNIGDLFLALKKNLPWSFTWERIRMSQDQQQPGNVRVELRIAFYSRKS